jgi:PAS domain S-box-containing protein
VSKPPDQGDIERLRQLFEHAPDGIFVADVEGRYTDVNEAGCRLLGYTREEILGKTIVDLILPSEVERLWQAREALLRGAVQVSEWTLRRRDGSLVPVEVSANILSDGRWQGFVRDISARQRDVAERKRLEIEQRLYADLGSILSTTLEHEETAARVAEVAVRDFADLCFVDLVDGVRTANQPRPALLESILESRQPYVLRHPAERDLAALAHDSDRLAALRVIDVQSLMVIPLIARGRLLGTLSLFSAAPDFVDDRRDLRIAQEIAHRAALAIDNGLLYRDAQQAARDRDEVLGMVAHDLRNPLAMIVMEARLLERGGDEPDRRWEQPGQQIQQAAIRINRLIQDLVDITRVEAGRLTVDRRLTHAAQVVFDTAEAHGTLAASATLELRLELPADLPEVLADRDRLLQVFENLMGNAIKFTPPGGRITVGASRDEGAVRFWVKDTGPGIPVEHQPHLFDRFWQARTARRGGAGLGLRIVKGIVETHGGRIWVESVPGIGSTFLFTIPIARQESASDLAAIAR